MLIIDVFRLSTRMFRTNRSRTILTILGIGVGIGTILFLVSLGYGLQRLILSRITTSEALLSLDVTTGDNEILKLNNEAIKNIEEISGVEKVSPLVSLQAQISIDDISSELTANFAREDYFRLDGTELAFGEFYSSQEEDKIVISEAALMLFNLKPEESYNKIVHISIFLPDQEEENKILRDSVNLDYNFKIKGIVKDENSNYIYLPLSIAQKLNIDNYSRLKVKVKDKDQLDSVRNSIIEKGFSVSALSDIIEQANQVFRVVQIVLALFGIVALIVSAIGMFNTMTIALLERTQEIGIMKALGATSVDIWNLFLGESIIIGFFGGVSGLVIGLVSGELFNYGVNLLAGALGGEKIDLFYTPLWFIILILVFSVVVGIITGIYPASRAAKINCLEALRYK